jgi:diguanylate cyclase (GGDEF)-like protein
MKLDQFTLDVVIAVLPLTFCVGWAGVWANHREFGAARYWFGGCLASSAGGIGLTLQTIYGPVPAVAANIALVLSWWLFWLGARRFYRARGGFQLAIGATLVCAVLMVVLRDHIPAIAAACGISQALPLVLIAHFLLDRSRRSIGASVATSGAVLALIGLGLMGAVNIVVLAHWLSPFQTLQAVCLTTLPGMVGGVLMVTGYAVMTADGLRAEVSGLADVDPLTGVWNRRRFDDYLSAEWSRSQRSQKPFALMLVDMDHFKDINDSLGHAAGDGALMHFVEIIRSGIRSDDFLARLGGDEFCVLLPETTSAQATTLGRRLTDLVSEKPFAWGGAELALSCSIGISAWSSSTVDADAVLARADSALYAAKVAGRGGVRGPGLMTRTLQPLHHRRNRSGQRPSDDNNPPNPSLINPHYRGMQP